MFSILSQSSIESAIPSLSLSVPESAMTPDPPLLESVGSEELLPLVLVLPASP